jgi:hypothetical protein
VPRFILLIALLVVGYLIYKLYFRQLIQQGKQGKIKIALIGLGLVFLALALAGRAPAIFALIGAAMTQVMRFAPVLLRFAPSLGRLLGGAGLGAGVAGAGGFGGVGGGEQTSRVRTGSLVMTLNHVTGSIDGEITSGAFAGKKLSALSIDEIKLLYQECQQHDPEAVRLLQAYVARERSDEWENAPQDEHSDNNSGTHEVSVREAYDILGLAAGASRKEIVHAHRSLMGKLHPDKGGSNYLAVKVNAAKKVLLDHVVES